MLQLEKPFQLFGISFAPLLVPLERRLQTLSVLYWILTVLVLPLLCSSVLLYLLSTRLWFLPVVYMSWMVYDRNGCNTGGRAMDGAGVQWLRNWTLWKHYRDYFPIRLVKTAPLPSSHNYIIGAHPHGVLSSGAFCSFATEGLEVGQVFPDITFRILTLEIQFLIPGYRELIAWHGACSSTKKSLKNLLSNPGGVAAVLVVGGAEEALVMDPTNIELVLNKRKGFVKYALEYGAHLVPTFSFGENAIYHQVSNPKGSLLRKLQDCVLRITGVAPLFFIGRGILQYTLGILPHRHPITVVVGAPIQVEKTQNPSKEQVENLHKEYVDQLCRLFKENNPKYGDSNTNIIIT